MLRAGRHPAPVVAVEHNVRVVVDVARPARRPWQVYPLLPVVRPEQFCGAHTRNC